MAEPAIRRRHLTFTLRRYVSVMPENTGSSRSSRSPMSRRQVLAGRRGHRPARGHRQPGQGGDADAPVPAGGGDGTPEQIHLTWGDHPATSIVVSWASPGQAARRPAAGADRAAGHPGRVPPVHRRDQRRDGLDLPRPGRRPAARRHLRLRGDRGQRQQRRRSVQRHLPHRPGGPRAVPLHQLRPGHAEHRLGALLRPERLRGRGGRVLPAAVPPAQRRPVLREPEPHGAARGMA